MKQLRAITQVSVIKYQRRCQGVSEKLHNVASVYVLLLVVLVFCTVLADADDTKVYWFRDMGESKIKTMMINHVGENTPDDLFNFITVRNELTKMLAYLNPHAAREARHAHFRSSYIDISKLGREIEDDFDPYTHFENMNIGSSGSSVISNYKQPRQLAEEIMATDPYCKTVGKRLIDMDLYIGSLTNLNQKGVALHNFLSDYHGPKPAILDVPYCQQPIPFRPDMFLHLKAMQNRKELANISEKDLIESMPILKELDLFGHHVKQSLDKNSTDWAMFNLAAIYWRVKGNSHMAIECAMRSLFHSPPGKRDSALINIANVFHRSRAHSYEAAILMFTVLYENRDQGMYFTLANVFGSLGMIQEAEILYEHMALTEPSFEGSMAGKHAARCQIILEENNLGSPPPSNSTTEQKQDLRYILRNITTIQYLIEKHKLKMKEQKKAP